MSFLNKTIFCVSGHAEHCFLCGIIQSNMLNIYHSPAHFFLSFHLSLPTQHQLQRLSQLQKSLVLCNFPLPDVVFSTGTMPYHWAFYFQSSEGSCILLWHLVWFYVKGAYCLARAKSCCPHVAYNGLLVIWLGGCCLTFEQQ